MKKERGGWEERGREERKIEHTTWIRRKKDELLKWDNFMAVRDS